jgi:hypothetical protein
MYETILRILLKNKLLPQSEGWMGNDIEMSELL